MIEPTTICSTGLQPIQIELEDNVLIIGAGALGATAFYVLLVYTIRRTLSWPISKTEIGRGVKAWCYLCCKQPYRGSGRESP